MTSLVPEYCDSGNENESNNEMESPTRRKRSPGSQNIERLPPPVFLGKVKNSVFTNPYLEAEKVQLALLERHVKMVPQTKKKTSQKVCRMFLNGKCPYKKKCHFSHETVKVDASKNNKNNDKLETRFKTKKPCISGKIFSERDEGKKKPVLAQEPIQNSRVLYIYKKQKDKF